MGKVARGHVRETNTTRGQNRVLCSAQDHARVLFPILHKRGGRCFNYFLIVFVWSVNL